ncbi:MAG TPA: TonB-dependent receptor [Kofleriaceae bacterium]|nr:TonB-dependent receptor [Kofleriaceae bacterium]
MRVTRLGLVVVVLWTGSASAQPEGEAADEETKPAPEESAEKAPEPPPATTGTIEGTVEAPDLDAPLAGATVTIVGSGITATTDDEGHFKLENVKPGSVKVRADFGGFSSLEQTIKVEVGATSKLDFQLATIPLLNETIVVVGSRTPRTNVETTVPVDVVTAEEMSRSGRTETGRVLHTLAASYISTPQSIADGTDHVDPASLRGLGPDQVLILINGKRRHRSALLHVNGTFGRGTVGTDLNAIPAGSIKRIEILRDGAAAQYGSDAIAGVINIVTKDVTDLLDVTAETGITAAGDGAQLKASANYGFKIGQKGFVNVTGEYLERQATDRSGTYTGTIYSDDPAIEQQMLGNKSRDLFKMGIGEAAAIAGMGSYNLELPINDVATFYSFGDLSHRRGAANGFYRFPKQVSQNVPEFYPNGFLPEIHPTIDDRAITIGMRRKGTWDVDASLTHGESSFQFNIEESVNASLGTSSPTTFDAGTLSFSETLANLDLLRKLDVDGIKSLALVLGSELRVERYQIEAGDEASYSLGPATYGTPPMPKLPGAQVFPGFQPSNEVDRTRDNIGLYGGIESELNKAIALDAGGRFETYSDFGRSLIGKVAARAKLGGPFAIRGAASTGFRAPSLQQLWFSNISTLFLADMTGTLQPTQVLTSNNASPVTKAFNIPRLREERSINFSGGITVHLRDTLSMSVDGYFIRLRDRIVLTSQFTNTNPEVAAILAQFPGVSQAQFFANAVDTDTKGIDVVFDYNVDAAGGQLAFTAAANFTRTDVTNVNIPEELKNKFTDAAQLRTFFFGRLAENRLEDSVPHQKGSAAVRYSINGVSALLRGNYYGKVYYRPDNAMNDEVFGAKVLVDADLGYQVTKNLLISVGADNMFNTFPDPQQKDANISFGRFIYSRNVSQFGMNGAFYYGKLQLTFF